MGPECGQRLGPAVCVLEQNYDATQRIPAYRSERAALSTYGQLEDRMALPADWLCARMACAQTFERESMFIADAVAAGLGRLGLNGQLLAPHGGSRVRLNVLTTNASLLHDEPKDSGIEGVCDRCKICVRQCPVGAITNVQGAPRYHQGQHQHRAVSAADDAEFGLLQGAICPALGESRPRRPA